MPSQTFHNLPADKRERILAAAKKEFSQTSFNDASINQIIKDAGISRGSFYMYFSDKYDLVSVLVDDFRTQFFVFMQDLASQCKGDLRPMVLGLNDFIGKAAKDKTNRGFVRNFLIYSGSARQGDETPERVNRLYKRFIARFIETIDTSRFKNSKPDFVTKVVEISLAAMHEVLRQTMASDLSMEASRDQLEQFMDIIEHGFLRKEE